MAALLAAPDEGSRRTGLQGLAQRETNQAIQSEFLGDMEDERFVGDGPYSRHTLLRPLAKVLARIATEPGPADIRADAARFLAYSEAKGAAEVLRSLAEDRDPQVREAAAIGLTFLGQTDHLETVRSIVSRPPERPAACHDGSEFASRKTRSSPWPASTRTRPSTSSARPSWATSRA